MENNTPNYPGWEIVRSIGMGSCGKVYEVKKISPFGSTEHSALKVISIPPSSEEFQTYYDELGLDQKSVSSLISSQVEDITNEINLMSKLKGNSHIVSYEDYSVVAHETDPGWDIFIRMELLTPLTAYLRDPEKEISEAEVVKLGVDLCNALQLCEQHNIVHRDIKPQNIFINKEGNFKLGDFGIAKTVDHTTSGTKTGTFTYMAPEVYTNKPYNQSVDIYSLGLVMYWMLNERRGPFLPLPPAVPTASDTSAALEQRMGGIPLPAPKHGSDALKRIVLRATECDAAARYATAAEMLRDLQALSGGPVAPSPAGKGETVPETDIPGPEKPVIPEPVGMEKKAKRQAKTEKKQETEKKKGKRKPLFIALACVAVLALLLALVLRIGGSKPSGTSNSSTELKLSRELLKGAFSIESSYSKAYQTLDFGGEAREMSLFPQTMIFDPELDSYSFLVFYDRYDYAYVLYGAYELAPKKGVLRFNPAEPLDEWGDYVDDILDTIGTEIETQPLAETLEYDFSLDYNSRLVLGRDGVSVKMRNTTYLGTGDITLSGSAVSAEDIFREIQSIEISCPKDGEYQCRVVFVDGGYTLDAEVSSLYDNICTIYIQWTQAMRVYNGRMELRQGRTSVSFDFLENTPFGFVLIDDSTNTSYYYQNEPLPFPEDGAAGSGKPLTDS